MALIGEACGDGGLGKSKPADDPSANPKETQADEMAMRRSTDLRAEAASGTDLAVQISAATDLSIAVSRKARARAVAERGTDQHRVDIKRPVGEARLLLSA